MHSDQSIVIFLCIWIEMFYPTTHMIHPVDDKAVPLDKAIFVLDLVEVGRRIYTQLRQTLIPENIIFPSYI